MHTPFAGFGDEDAYPELLDRAAVLITHLVQNHPLPDGNKRAALLLTALYLEQRPDVGDTGRRSRRRHGRADRCGQRLARRGPGMACEPHGLSPV